MISRKVAVVQFPGSNCEIETINALKFVGLSVDLLPWNASEDIANGYDAFVLPGGFSFQDRIRAGVVASKLGIMKTIVKAANEGKPVLGICNGCQILAETGLVPDYSGENQVSLGLAPNVKGNKKFGFICDWVFVKVKRPKNNIFTRYFNEEDVIPIQINHGEGNMVFSYDIQNELNELATFTYCNLEGDVEPNFPVNPNGTSYNLAGLSNKSGNVFAMMPHPERGAFLYQVPGSLQSEWSRRKRIENGSVEGPWFKLFLSLKDFLKGN